MKFEWDAHKNQANGSKHGIDFETATKLWDDPYRIEIQTSFTEEDRTILIGKIDVNKSRIIKHGKKVRITLDIAEALVKDIDQIRGTIGVDRAALIKIWLHERIQKEKTISR